MYVLPRFELLRKLLRKCCTGCILVCLYLFGYGQQPVDRAYRLPPGENSTQNIHDHLFIRATVSKTSCYVQEPILVKYKLYSRLPQQAVVTRLPAFSGAGVYRLPVAAAQSVEIIGGQSFSVKTLYAVQVIPLQAGTLQPDAIEVRSTLQPMPDSLQKDTSQPSAADLPALVQPEQFAPATSYTYALRSKPVTIQVKPLPPATTGSTRAVGQYSIIAHLMDSTGKRADDQVVMLEVKGWGNLPFIDTPHIDWPQGILVTDMQTSDAFNTNVFPLNGSKFFRYRIAAAAGNYPLPVVQFNYFDPSLNRYAAAISQPGILSVVHGTDILPVTLPVVKQPVSTPAAPGAEPGGGYALWGWLGLGLLLFCVINWWRWSARIEAANREEKEKEEMNRRDPLEKAREKQLAGDYRNCYQEIIYAINSEMALASGFAYGAMNKQALTRYLELINAPLDLRKQFTEIINDCDRQLYVPKQLLEDPTRVLQKTEDAFKKLYRLVDQDA